MSSKTIDSVIIDRQSLRELEFLSTIYHYYFVIISLIAKISRGFFSSLEVDSSVPLTRYDPRYLGLICLEKKRKIRFRILSDLRIQSSILIHRTKQGW